MTINYVAFSRTAYTVGDGNTAITGTLPSGGANGNLLVAYLACAGGVISNTMTPPAGWTVRATNFSEDGRWTAHQAFAFAVRADALDLTFEFGAAGEADQLIITEWSGDWDEADPVMTGSVATDSLATSFVAPSRTTAVDGSILLSGCAADNGFVTTPSYPAGMTGIVNERSNSASWGVRSGVAYEVIATAGATGTRTWSGFTDDNQYGAAASVVINHSSGSPAPAVNPTGTDLVLVEGGSYEIAMSNMTGIAATGLVIRYTAGELIVNSTQAEFVYTPTDDTGVIAFDATRNNLPFGATGFEYVITLDEGDPIVYAMTSFSEAAGRDYIVVVDHVTGNTGLIYQVVSGTPSDGDQYSWTLSQSGLTLAIRANGTFYAASETFPETATIAFDYWSLAEGVVYELTADVRFSPDGEGTVVGVTVTGYTTQNYAASGYTVRGF